MRRRSRTIAQAEPPPSKATHPHYIPITPATIISPVHLLIDRGASSPQAHLASAKTTIVPLDSPLSRSRHHIRGELTTSLPYSAHAIAKIANVRTFETIDMAFAHFSDRATADCLADVSRACIIARLWSV